jgi:hypothetical protein
LGAGETGGEKKEAQEAARLAKRAGLHPGGAYTSSFHNSPFCAGYNRHDAVAEKIAGRCPQGGGNYLGGNYSATFIVFATIIIVYL